MTSDNSGFLVNRKKVQDIPSYKDGLWWIQDFSSSFPLNNINEKIFKKSCIDMCAAPGGKAFQVLAKKGNLIMNDKSKQRIEMLNENLKG